MAEEQRVEVVDVRWHACAVSREDRERAAGHRGCVLWFTGLSGCGKSTVANAVDRLLYERGCRTFLLDGDNVRHGLNAAPALLEARHGAEFSQRFGLGFGPQDREENIRRIAEVAALMNDAGLIVITSFISPYISDRAAAREVIGDERFVEVFIDTPIEVCEQRDPKGLYKKARAGEIQQFTGISAPYEAPQDAEMVIATEELTPEAAAHLMVEDLKQRGIIG